jgi:hypothetical protein
MLDLWMAPKYHPTPLSGGDRKAVNKELGKARAMTGILAAQSAEMRAKAETMLQQADRLPAKAGTSGCGQTAKLQRPLSDGSLRIIARGAKEDPAWSAT